jgi:hypothetical protein
VPLAEMLKCHCSCSVAGNDDCLDAARYQLIAELFGKGANLGFAARAIWVTGTITNVDGGFGWETRLYLAQDSEAADS